MIFVLSLVLIVNAVVSFLSDFNFPDDKKRVMASFLCNFLFWHGVAQGGIAFYAVVKLAKGFWAKNIVRIAQSTFYFLIVSSMSIFVLFLGRDIIFPYVEHPNWWMNTKFTFGRDGALLFAMILISFLLVKNSVDSDALYISDEQKEKTKRKIKILSVVFIPLYFFSYTIISWDLVMSLTPGWFSTVFGPFYFIGMFYTFLSIFPLMLLYVKNRYSFNVTESQFHSIGNLMLGFVGFWTYLFYVELNTIYQGNIPEEAHILSKGFFKFSGVFWTYFATSFVIPFFLLFSIKLKRSFTALSLIGIVMFIGALAQRYLMVYSRIFDKPYFGWIELSLFGGFLGAFLICFNLFLRTVPLNSKFESEWFC
mgnify:CR=1 FL=1